MNVFGLFRKRPDAPHVPPPVEEARTVEEAADSRTFFERYEAMREMEEHRQRAKRAESDRVEYLQKSEILSTLEKAGVPNDAVHTNGYWFHFIFKGMSVTFVNQTFRLCGEVHRPPKNDLEVGILKDSCRFRHMSGKYARLAEEFRKEFLYDDFVIDGKDPARTVTEVLRIAERQSRRLR